MNCPIHLRTKEGLQEFNAVLSQKDFCDERGISDWFCEFILRRSTNIDTELVDWMENNFMDDNNHKDQNWKTYRLMDDRSAVFRYFATRKM